MNSLEAKFLFTASLACAFTFTACGSDSSSGSVSEPMDSIRISVDEASQTLTLYGEDKGACLYDGESAYSWNDSYRTMAGQENHPYFFIGDTLAIMNTDDPDDYGLLFVGGKKGTLYGTWTLLNNCDFEDGSIDCSDDDYDETVGYEIQYTFTKNSLSTRFALLFDDYMNSNWMNEFYSGFLTKYFYMSRAGFFFADSAGVAAAIQSAGIEIQSQTKTGVTFTFNDKSSTLQLSIQKITYNEMFYSVTVQSESGLCALTVETTNDVTESLCSAENADYLEWYEIDNGDSTDYVVEEYYRDNRNEFNDCLENMFFSNTSTGNISLFKKGAEEKEDRAIEKKRVHFLSRIQKLAH